MANTNLPDGGAAAGNGIPIVSGGRASSGGADVHNEMFRSLADQSLEFIGMCDLAFQPFYVNPAGMRMVGLDSLEKACAVKVQDFFFPEDQRYIVEEFFPKVLKEGRGEVEIRFRHFQTGAALWMIYNVFQVRDAEGQVSGYATVSRDMTERKRAEEALRQAHQRLVYHTGNTPLGVIEFDAEMRVSAWSEQARRVFGWEAAEVVSICQDQVSSGTGVNTRCRRWCCWT